MKRLIQNLIHLFFYNRFKRHQAQRSLKLKPDSPYSNGEDWYKFGI